MLRDLSIQGKRTIKCARQSAVLDNRDTVEKRYMLEMKRLAVDPQRYNRRRMHDVPLISQGQRDMFGVRYQYVSSLQIVQALTAFDKFGMQLLAPLFEPGIAFAFPRLAADFSAAHTHSFQKVA